MTVGILALQGDFREHEEVLCRIGVATHLIRLPEQLDFVDRLIIPGGESTTIGKLLVLYNLLEPIRSRAEAGMPLWGTCAGAILMAKHIADGRPEQPSLAVMNITARRNAFGRQNESFTTELSVSCLGKKPLSATFIRAPILEQPESRVKILATLPDGKIVAAQEGKLLATCFHPELHSDDRLHQYFVQL